MKSSPIQIVVIHDDISELDPLIVELEIKYGKDNVKLIRKSQEGVDYVLNNLSKKMIVILDLNFKANEPTGVEVFEDIRKKTSLVYIIIWTASDLNNIHSEDLIKFINNDALAFEYSTADYTRMLELVEKAANQLDIRIDTILEEWICKQKQEEREKAFILMKGGKILSLNDILESIRQRTHDGVKMEKNILKLAVDLLARQKRELND